MKQGLSVGEANFFTPAPRQIISRLPFAPQRIGDQMPIEKRRGLASKRQQLVSLNIDMQVTNPAEIGKIILLNKKTIKKITIAGLNKKMMSWMVKFFPLLSSLEEVHLPNFREELTQLPVHRNRSLKSLTFGVFNEKLPMILLSENNFLKPLRKLQGASLIQESLKFFRPSHRPALKSLRVWVDGGEQANQLVRNLRNLASLEELEVSISQKPGKNDPTFDDEELFEAIFSLSALKKLSLKHCRLFAFNNLLQVHPDPFPNLEFLILEDVQGSLNFNSLERLRIKKFSNVTPGPKDIRFALQEGFSIPTLETLKISIDELYFEKTTAPEFITNITTLEITINRTSGLGNWRLNPLRAPFLRNVFFHRGFEKDYIPIIESLYHLPSLSCLDLGNIDFHERLPDHPYILTQISTGFPNLERFRCSITCYDSKVTKASFKVIFPSVKHIRLEFFCLENQISFLAKFMKGFLKLENISLTLRFYEEDELKPDLIGMKELLKAIRSQQHLKCFDLSIQDFRKEGSSSILPHLDMLREHFVSGKGIPCTMLVRNIEPYWYGETGVTYIDLKTRNQQAF